MFARALVVGLLVGSISDAVLALGRDRTIAQFHHTAWTAKDGAPSQITALAQTTDGFLWIGTARGLFRFDGVQFERYTPPAGVTLPSENIYTILATPDGGLWISFRSRGLGFLKNGRLTVFTRPDEIPQSWVYSFASDHDSRLWAGTYEGLALRQGTRWLEIGPEWNLERGRVWSMIADREGTLWVGIGTRLRFLRRGSTRFEDAGVSASVKRLAQSTAQPGAMHSAFEQFAAFSKDAEDNKVTQRTKLPMPVLAVGGAKSFGALMAVNMRNIADDVTEAIVPEAGHWLMEENPEATVALIGDFLSEKQRQAGDRRIAPAEYQFSTAIAGGTGTSSVEGIRTVVVKGDPNAAGLYTIMLYVPAHTRIAAHQHRDDRVATVVSGTWYFGYGDEFDATALKALPAGSYYTEAPRRAHFAETRGEPAIVQISGVGPSDTQFIKPKKESEP